MSEQHSEFWQWALDRWQGAGAARLLELQDKNNVVILELMYVAWLGLRGRAISREDLAQLRACSEAWIDQVVLPLRQVRRAWKTEGKAATLRARLKTLELEAEHGLANLYAESLPLTPMTSSKGSAEHSLPAFRHNLELVLERTGLQTTGELYQQLEQHLRG
jgi:uncharacterized protein (TIGR02444 family)